MSPTLLAEIAIVRAQRMARMTMAARSTRKISLRVAVGRLAHLYTRAIPAMAVPVGIVITGTGEVGALVRLGNGLYARVNDGTVHLLNKREVLLAMQDARPLARG